MTWLLTMFFTLQAGEQGVSNINYIERGAKEAASVLFVHGTPGNAEAFKTYYEDEEFQKEYHMVSVDRLGFGDSPKAVVTTLGEHADSILTLIKQHGPNKVFSCVGHSYGVPVCLKMMAEDPDRFNGGVMIAGVSNPNRKILRWYNYLANTWFIKLFLSRGFENSNEEMKSLKQELYKLEPLLEGIQKDKIVPFPDSHHLKGKLINAKVKVLSPESMGHLLIWTKKDYLKNELQIFFKDILKSKGS